MGSSEVKTLLQYTKRPRWIKRSELFGEASIAVEAVSCDTPIPADIASEHLCTNEVVEVDVITGGSGICQVFGQSIPCKEMDVFVIPPDIPHNRFVTETGEALHYTRLVFDARDWLDSSFATPCDPRFCYGVLRGGSVIAYATLHASIYDEVVRMLDAVSRETAERQQDWEHSVRAQLSLFFITLSRYIHKADCVPTDSDKEWRHAGIAVRTIMENFTSSDFRMETLAESLYISKSQFSQLFKAFTGEHFSDYLRNVRLHHACKLLRETDLAVEQIVEACGMRDTKTFGQNFKKYMGVTPGQYRAQNARCTAGETDFSAALDAIAEALQQGRATAVTELVQQALHSGCAPERILNEGLLCGMDAVGKKFRTGEAFVPEVLVATRAMHKGSELLKPYFVAGSIAHIGRACLGTVQGDLHDIGKNLVKMMLEGKGIEVVDLGTDVPAETFVQTAIAENCDIICCSALLTTTMGVMADVVKAAEAAGIRERVKIMIGGAPITEEFCRQIGADCYTKDAASAAEAAAAFCKAKKP